MVGMAAPATFSDHAVRNSRLQFFPSSTSHLWLLHFLLPIPVFCSFWQWGDPLQGQWNTLYSSHPTQPYLSHFQLLAPFLWWCCCSLGFLCLFWSLDSWTRHQGGFARAVALLGNPLHAPLTHGPQSQGTAGSWQQSHVGTALSQLFSLISSPTLTFRKILSPCGTACLLHSQEPSFAAHLWAGSCYNFPRPFSSCCSRQAAFSVSSAPNVSLHLVIQIIDIKTY